MQNKYPLPIHPSPITHWAVGDYIRVPMVINDDEFILSVGDNDIRIYTDETLPDFIKSLMAMIHVFTPNLFNFLDGTNVFRPSSEKYYVNQHSIYDNNMDRRLDEIGWQLTSHFYMLILTTNQFNEVKNGNARKEDKKQSDNCPS